MSDEEPHFSALVAERLKIAHRLLATDDGYDPRFDVQTAEPGALLFNSAFRRVFFTEMASQAKVWFAGEGPDNALTFEWQSYLRWLTKRRDWIRLAGSVAQYIRGKEAREWVITIKKSIPRWREARSFPPWINQDIVKCLDLTTRAKDYRRRRTHPWRPQAIANFTSPFWQRYFEFYDPAISGTPLDWRHPYTDLRVLIFMLRTPPIPWARRKWLIREAMRGILPEEVLKRDKAPLAADPRSRVAWKMPPPPLWMDVTLCRFVDPTKLPDGSQPQSAAGPLAKLWALHVWLRDHHPK
jgi:asparagine synthase (glutamine-hydrolysing)